LSGNILQKVSQDNENQPLLLDKIHACIDGSLQKLRFISELNNHYIVAPGELKQMWQILEGLKAERKLKYWYQQPLTLGCS